MTDCFTIIMDAAEAGNLHGAVSAQGRFLGEQADQIQRISEHVAQLTSNMSQVTSLLATSSATRQHPMVPTAAPERYDGDQAKCWGFLLQFKLFIT